MNTMQLHFFGKHVKEASYGIRLIGADQHTARLARAIGNVDAENFAKDNVKARIKMMQDGSYMEF